MLDLSAQIEPGKSAAGLRIGEPLPRWAISGANATSRLGDGLELLDLGAVRVWIRSGRIFQIGLRDGYKGFLSGTELGIGSPLGYVVQEVGPVIEDDEDNLVVPDLPGWSFETTPWIERPGGGVPEENLAATITEIFVH